MDRIKEEFLGRLDSGRYLADIFEDSPDLYFFTKDRSSSFTMCNRALLDKLGVAREADIIGTDDYAYFEKAVADKYREEDLEVFHGRRPMTNRIWLVPNASGVMEWYLSSKFPLFDCSGEVIGLAGLMRDCMQPGSLLGPYKNMGPAIDFISAHFREPITVRQLAKMTRLSVSQFERNFKKLFKITPRKYLTQVRLDAAARLLIETTGTIAAIAHETGFYDQSYFTKQFKAAKGVTPARYRRNSLEQRTG
jgi:AraC-like DNA-binding protein